MLKENDLMKQIALLDGNSDGLLQFYREKLSSVEKEKIEFLSSLEVIKLSQKEKHNLEWANYQLTNRNNELEKGLSDSKITLLEERTNNIKLKNENIDLKERLEKNNQKIYNLIGSMEVIEQKNIYDKLDIKSRYVKNDLNLNNNLKKNKTNYIYDSKSISKNKELRTKQNNDTVKISINEDQYDSNIFNSKKQKFMQDEITIQKHQIENLRKEINSINSTNNSYQSDLKSQIKLLKEKNQKLERINLDLNKEYFSQKSLFFEIEKKLNEEIDLQKRKIIDLDNQNKNFKEENENENKIRNNLIEMKNEEYIQKFKTKSLLKEQELQILKEQYKKVQGMYKNKIDIYEKKLKELKLKLKTSQTSYNLENQGLKVDNRNLKEKLKGKTDILKNMEKTKKKKVN